MPSASAWAMLTTALSQVDLACAALYDQVIETQYGAVQGYPAFNKTPSGNLSHWRDVTVWKGIPFAASTAGENRWKAPQPVSSWNDTLDARDFGDICPSSSSSPEYTVSENCLNLNIWSAANSTDAKLPVVMWSYPAYSTAADSLFDGGGSLGWLAHPELSAEFEAATGHNSSGNWGMLDQFEALKWIHANIAAFGGDPDRITVMGQSAGSAATQHILNSPLTEGLIVGAIIESGVRDPHDPLCSSLAENYRTLDFALNQGVEYLMSKNVSTIAEARQLSYENFVDNSQFSFGDTSSDWVFTATLDYYAIPDTYYNTLLEGAANDVPVLTGNTRDESGATYGLNITVAQYLADLNETYSGKWVDEFLALYPAANSSQASISENLQFTHRSMIGTWLWAHLWRTNATSPVWTYLWDHAPPGQDQGAYHESEINYVLNNLYGTDKSWKSADYQIAATMNAYWVNFIKTGNPNGDGLVQWPVTDETEITQQLGYGWGSMPIGSKAQVKLITSWLNIQPLW